MDDANFELLKVQASVAPGSASWPKPDYSKTTLGGADGKPQVDQTDLHWSALHDAVSHARESVLKVLGSMAAIDDDKTLSPPGKLEKKREIATKALAALDKSQHLLKAQSAVERKVAGWDKDLGLTPKAPEGVGDAMIQAEIRSHLASLKSADRMAFIDANAGEVASAVLTAPAFLSGLTPAELGVVRQRIEARANPEIAAAKAATVTALAEAERGWRNASNQIRSRGGLEKPHNGP